MSDLPSLIDQAAGYAAKMLQEADNALRNAGNVDADPVEKFDKGNEFISVAKPPDIRWDDDLEAVAPNLTLPPLPQLDGSFVDAGDIVLGIAPVFAQSAPTLVLPSQPAPLAAFTQPPPAVVLDAVFPDPPQELDASAILPPTIVDRAAPTKPSVVLPEFMALAPTNSATAPTDAPEQMREAYRQAVPEMVTLLESQLDAMLTRINPQFHAQMQRIEARIEAYLSGGSGLDAAVETALYERARDKSHAEYRRLHDSALVDAAAKGFTLPTGAVLGAQFSARLALADANARAAQDIAIKQAEMEQQNLQFAVTTSSALRTSMLNAAMGYHGALVQINAQALELGKMVGNVLIEQYNAQVRGFSLALEAYKAEAAIFEARLKGALSAVEFYKAEIDAMQALTQVDAAKIGIYESRMKSIAVLADVYRTRVEAVKSRAELEKIRVDLYQAQVQSYGALVSAKNAEWQGYQAAIGGEEAKLRVFSEQVQAFTAEVNSYKAITEAKAEQVKTRIAVNQGLLHKQEMQVKLFSAEVDARTAMAKAQADFTGVKLNIAQEKIKTQVIYAQSLLDYHKARYQEHHDGRELDLRRAIADAQNELEASKARAASELGVGKAYADVAQAALGGMNTIVSMVG